jgi:hypothetical protein
MYKTLVKRGAIAISFLLVLALILPNINGFGISTQYIENDLIKLEPGQSYVYAITIQNAEEEDYIVNITYTSTKDIAILRDRNKLIPTETFNNTFYFDITIPRNSTVGEEYYLRYAVRPIINNTTLIPSSMEIGRQINILVVDSNGSGFSIKTEEDKTTITEYDSKIKELLYYFAGILAIILFIIIVLRIWKLSTNISTRINPDKVTDYTISESKKLYDIIELLEKLSDEQFEIEEIRKLFVDKVLNVTKVDVRHRQHISRKELLRTLKK